jgi:branched-chain amino acid transport system ATP-binding protein
MVEPTAGMSPVRAGGSWTLPHPREERIAVLFTEHDMDVVFGHANRDRPRPQPHNRRGPPAVIRAACAGQAVYLGENA